MSDYDDVVNSLRLIMSGVRYVNFRQATTGKLNADGSLNLNATEGLPDGYIWVRYGEDRSAAVVKNMTMRNVAGVHVEVVHDRHHQEDQVWEVDRVRALEAMGAAAAAAMNVPEQGVYISTPISARDVTFLNLFPDESGGLVVRVTAGMLPSGAWWGGATTTTLTPTASGGKKSLVCVGINPIGLTYVKTLAADRTFGEDLIANRELTEDGAADVKAVMDADPGVVWVGAVELTNGDTTIDASQVASLLWRLPKLTGATSGDAGAAGLVPAPAAGQEDFVLTGAAAWAFRHLTSTTATTLAIAGGAATMSGAHSFAALAAESGTSDDLDTLTVTGAPRLIVLQADAGDTIAVKHNTGNIKLNNAADFELVGDKTICLFWDGTNLADIGAPASAASVVVRQTVFTYEGTLSVTGGSIRIPNVMGEGFTITKVGLLVSTAPVGAAIIVDVNKNGSTIFTTQANRPQIAAGANSGSTTTIDVSAWADGDYLTVDIDQVGSTVPGSFLTVVVVFE